MQWVHVVIDVPDESIGPSTSFWERALGWPLGPAWPGHLGLASFEPPQGQAYVHRQVGSLEARVHLDLEVADIDAETARLARIGAHTGPRQPRWQVMRSPGGLPFCLVEAMSHDSVPQALALPRHRSRLVQVCIDSPPDRHHTEVAFWRAATAGIWTPGDSPEFAGKLYPSPGGGPVQLLLQRLGPAAGGAVTAHVDLGTDDVDAEVHRLTGFGAQPVAPGRGWTVLTDPAGMTFCVTDNPPD